MKNRFLKRSFIRVKEIPGRVKNLKPRLPSIKLFIAGPESSAANPQVIANIPKKLVLGAGSMECAKSFGTTAFKGVSDYTEGDRLCTGLCAVASACEVVAFTSCLVAFPGSYMVYLCAKGASLSCMEFRNRCKELQGKKLPGC